MLSFSNDYLKRSVSVGGIYRGPSEKLTDGWCTPEQDGRYRTCGSARSEFEHKSLRVHTRRTVLPIPFFKLLPRLERRYLIPVPNPWEPERAWWHNPSKPEPS